MNLWSMVTSSVGGALAAGSKAVAHVSKGISSIFSGFGGGGAGTIKYWDNPSSSNSSSSGGSGSGSGSGSGGSGGSGGSEDSGGSDGSSSDDSSNDNTTENVKVNDPEKNKALAEIRMSEELRETLNFTITIPKILKGLKTNQWFFMEISENFYEANYPTIMEKIAEMKFGRYAGFKKGRFFVEKIVEKGGTDGTSTTITLNPIAPSYSQYVKMQMDAEKALVDALNDTGTYQGNGIGVSAGGGITSKTLIGIGNQLGSKYTFCGRTLAGDSRRAESYTDMKKVGCGSCFAWSGALYTELTAKGFKARVVQYATAKANNHRSVQVYINGAWEDYPYAQTNIHKWAWAYAGSSNGWVLDEATLKTIL